AIRFRVASRAISWKRGSPVASNCRMAAPNWKPWVHSVQPRLVYCPRTVKTGVPCAGFQRCSSRRIFCPESSNSRLIAGTSAWGVRESSILITSQPLQVDATIDVDDIAGGERKIPLHEHADRQADVLGGAPALL